MSRIELETYIAAPPERCFDLSLSVELHLDSTAETGERAVAGTTSGVLRLGDTVTWEARHFGLRLRLSTQITAYDRPRMFRDEMISGPFRRLAHGHFFEPEGDGTKMRDVFEFASFFAPLDRVVIAPHLRRLLNDRNAFIRAVAEAEDCRRCLSPSSGPPGRS